MDFGTVFVYGIPATFFVLAVISTVVARDIESLAVLLGASLITALVWPIALVVLPFVLIFGFVKGWE